MKDVQLTPQNRVTEIKSGAQVYRFYSQGAWDGPKFMMPPAQWTGETRSEDELNRAMFNSINSGIARPYPKANAI